MVDTMAPVFDIPSEAEDPQLRIRQGDLGKRRAQDTIAERQTRSERDSLRRRDDRDDDDERQVKNGGRQKSELQEDDRDGDDDDARPAGNTAGALLPPVPVPTNLFGIDPLNPLSGLISASSTPPALLRTSSIPTTTKPPPSLSSTSSLPTPASNHPVAVNPQVPVSPVFTVSSGTLMTATTSLLPSSTKTSSFIDTLFPSSSSTTASKSGTAMFESAVPSPTIFLSDTGNNGDRGKNGGGHDDQGPPPGGLSPTAEDVLISAGSIGAFILICFVCWMGWRMYKKSQRVKNGMDDDEFRQPNALLARIPYFGRSQGGWQDLDARSDPSMYESSKPSAYSMTSGQNMKRSPSSKQGPMSLPQLDTNVSYSNVNPFSASSGGTFHSHSTQSPQSLAMRNAVPYSQQEPLVLPQLQTTFTPTSQANNPFASHEDHMTRQPPYSPTSAAQYMTGTMRTFDTLTSDRSRMPDPVYNQSELARQASTAYDPAKRAVYRASELSSISSGFGDGDIIVPPPAAHQQGLEPRPFSFAKSAGGLTRNNSVANRSDAGSHGQRDTVYTTTSEDMPARYRSVNSWVNQQTGRIQRQQQSEGEDVPPVPSLPPEDRYTMMMDDEEPRRYEDTLSSQPPVPMLPSQRSD